MFVSPWGKMCKPEFEFRDETKLGIKRQLLCKARVYIPEVFICEKASSCKASNQKWNGNDKFCKIND